MDLFFVPVMQDTVEMVPTVRTSMNAHQTLTIVLSMLHVQIARDHFLALASQDTLAMGLSV